MNFDARKKFDTISVQINFVQFIYVFMFGVNILTLQKLRRSIKKNCADLPVLVLLTVLQKYIHLL